MIGALLALCCTAYSADIIVFGDSWGTYGAASFEKMANSKGLTVDNVAVSGSKASDWAADPNCLADVLANNPDARYVWLTIGGNDARPKMEAGEPIDSIVAQVLADIIKFIEPAFALRPDIKLVTFGYDILFWDYPMCRSTGDKMFVNYCGPRSGADYIGCCNRLFYTIQWECTDVLAAKYKQISSPNLLGSWQAAGGIPGAGIGKPVDGYFSPNEFTGPLKLCLHANDKGYDVIFQNLWDLFFDRFEPNRTALSLPPRPAYTQTSFESFQEWKQLYPTNRTTDFKTFAHNWRLWVKGASNLAVSELGVV